MIIDLYLREKNGERELRIPILPEKLEFRRGDATFVTCEIMKLGEVAVPTGTELSAYAWASVFPGVGRRNDPLIHGTWYVPKWYDSTLEDWKKKGTLVNLLVTGYPINADVYVKAYQSEASGAFGDIVYELELVEARSITIQTSKVQTPTQTTTQRASTTSNSYTIKTGDTLWEIAKKLYNDGNKWSLIYNANKDIIEQTAKKHGKSSSENGWWIFPGVTLTIPKASVSAGTPSKTTKTSPTKGVSDMVQRIKETTNMLK